MIWIDILLTIWILISYFLCLFIFYYNFRKNINSLNDAELLEKTEKKIFNGKNPNLFDNIIDIIVLPKPHGRFRVI